MPGLGTTPDESGFKSPSGGAVHSPGIYARAKVAERRGRALQTPSEPGCPHLPICYSCGRVSESPNPLARLRARAAATPRPAVIVLAEGADPRVVVAAERATTLGLCRAELVGTTAEV